MTFPVVLGTGKRLFGDGTPPCSLRLLEQQVGEKGVIVTRWTLAGPIPAINHPYASGRCHAWEHCCATGCEISGRLGLPSEFRVPDGVLATFRREFPAVAE